MALLELSFKLWHAFITIKRSEELAPTSIQTASTQSMYWWTLTFDFLRIDLSFAARCRSASLLRLANDDLMFHGTLSDLIRRHKN